MTLHGEPNPRQQHAYPLGDNREHVLIGDLCWCNPKIQRTQERPLGNDDEIIVIHSAADGRAQDYPGLHEAN